MNPGDKILTEYGERAVIQHMSAAHVEYRIVEGDKAGVIGWAEVERVTKINESEAGDE